MITVAVLGATGYTALEAIKILLRHPEARITAVTSRQEGSPPISTVHPSLVGRLDLPLEDLSPEEVGKRADCVFSCLPHCASAEIIPRVIAAGARSIRVSGLSAGPASASGPSGGPAWPGGGRRRPP